MYTTCVIIRFVCSATFVILSHVHSYALCSNLIQACMHHTLLELDHQALAPTRLQILNMMFCRSCSLKHAFMLLVAIQLA